MAPVTRPETHPVSGPHSVGTLPAVLVAGLAVLASLTSLVHVTMADAWATGPAAQLPVDAVAGITYPLVGSLMLLAGRLGPGAKTLAWIMVASGAAAASAALFTALALATSEVTTTSRLWVQLQSFLWVPGFLPLLTLVPLYYPDGLLGGRFARVWHITAYVALTGITLLTVGVALYDEPLHGLVTLPKLVTATGPATVLSLASAVLLVPCALAALAALVVRYRASRGLERRQVVVLLVTGSTLALVTALQGAIPSPIDLIAQAAAVALTPLAIGVAVTRHRLYELDLAVCRALVAASLAACLAGAYLTLFALVQAVTGGSSALSAAVAAGAAGAVLQPLGQRLNAEVDRLYFGHRADPYLVTSKMARLLTTSGSDVAHAPQIICDVVVSDLLLPGARLWMDGAGSPTLEASQGELDEAETARFALEHRGTTVAWLETAPRSGQSRLHERDELVLRGLADQAAPAVAALRLQQELQHSRESLVAARETERRWLRQELHDGLGATLAGLRLQIESAQHLAQDPRVDRILAAASDGVSQAVGEVRSVVENLRPPGIDDLGLARALVCLGQRTETPQLRVEVLVDDDLGPDHALDPAVEVALYRIAAEALANVAKHSCARQATMHVRTTPDTVQLTVTDDGTGVDPASKPEGSRVGLASMRQRAEEIGGHVIIGPLKESTGTVVQATLPLTVGISL